MNDFPWLTVVTFLPLVFGIIVLLLPKENGAAIRGVAFLGTILTLLVSIGIWFQYHPAGIASSANQFALVESRSWIPSINVKYLMGMDGISLLMVLMTTGIWPFVVGVSFSQITERIKQYYFWILLMETAVLGVFLSLDLVLFYVFWEAMLIPMYFLMGIWGGPNRIYATIKFFLYTMAGSMVMLVSIMALYFLSGHITGVASDSTFDLRDLLVRVPLYLSQGSHTTVGIWLFLGFFFAFGIKAPIWPFHSWVADAYSEAPTGGSIILVALKMGLYGFIRFCLPLFPAAVTALAPAIIVLAVIGVVYAALVAAMQTDLKRLIAYSSVSHIGVIMLSIFALTGIGISGAVLQMVSHTITTGALFIIGGYLYARRRTYAIADFGGLMKPMPQFTAVFLIVTLSAVALPLTSGFSGEILMLLGSFQTHPWATGVATTSAIWSVVYMLWMFQRVMYGKIDKPENANLPDLRAGERWALVPLVIAIFAIGIYPNPLLKRLNGSVGTIINQANLTELTPTNPVIPTAMNTPAAVAGHVRYALLPEPVSTTRLRGN